MLLGKKPKNCDCCFFVDLSWVLLFTATLFPPPTSALVMGVWADPFVPTAILGETHFIFPLLLIIYSILLRWRKWQCIIFIRSLFEDLTVRTKKKHRFFFFPFLVLVGSFTKDGFLTFIPACCFSPSPPPPLPSSPLLFLLLPFLLPLLPRQTRGSPGLRLASLHPIRIACRACDVTYMFDLSYAWTDMWTGCGGVSKGGNGGAVCPSTKATACWSQSSCTETQTEIKHCERETEKLS